MYDDYEFIDCNCSKEQQEWQEKVVKALIPLGKSLRDAVNDFNQQENHEYSLVEEVTVDIVCEWLKYFNSFQLLVKYGKFDVSLTILRSLLELSLQLCYLLVKDKEIKAAYYFVSFFIKGHQHNLILLKDRNDAASLETLKKSATVLDRLKFHTDVNAQMAYKKVMPDDVYKPRDAEKEWYKLYFEYELKKRKKDHFSITQMLDIVADELDPTRLLLKKDILYSTLSIHAHGLVAPMNVSISNNVQTYKSFENPHYAGWILDVITKLTQLNFLALRKGYPDYQWIDDETLINIGNEINSCIVEWAERFKKLN